MDETKYFEKVAEYKLLAKHEVGQNFLVDSDVARKIVELAEINKEDKVLEIGSGAGSLSYFIEQLASDADLIDIDEGLIQKITEDFKESSNLHIQLGNAMKWDYEPYTKIISNLPYYITSAILERILLTAKRMVKGVFMVQKEVLSRINAPVGNDNYGPLSILIKYRAKYSKGFVVSRNSFVPAPHIESAVFVLDVLNDNVAEANELYSMVSAMFLHKRKTILNNLGSYLKDNEKAKTLLVKAKIPENKRPQEINLEQYLSLLAALK